MTGTYSLWLFENYNILSFLMSPWGSPSWWEHLCRLFEKIAYCHIQRTQEDTKKQWIWTCRSKAERWRKMSSWLRTKISPTFISSVRRSRIPEEYSTLGHSITNAILITICCQFIIQIKFLNFLPACPVITRPRADSNTGLLMDISIYIHLVMAWSILQ